MAARQKVTAALPRRPLTAGSAWATEFPPAPASGCGLFRRGPVTGDPPPVGAGGLWGAGPTVAAAEGNRAGAADQPATEEQSS